MPSTPAVSEWATKEDLGNCSASCLSDFPLGPSAKAEASLVRSVPPEALRLGESRDPLGYFATNTPPPDFSCPATKAPVAAFSMR